MSAEECQQACLRRPACKAYRWDASIGNPCAIFNVGIGPNAAHLISPTPSGTQWFDRDCQVHAPAGCTSAPYPYSNATAISTPAVVAALDPDITAAPVETPGVPVGVFGAPVQAQPALPIVPNPPSLSEILKYFLPPAVLQGLGTPLPPLPPLPAIPGLNAALPSAKRDALPEAEANPAPAIAPVPQHVQALAKRGAPFPSYFADLSYVWSSVYVTPACSCIITSALPPVPSTTTTTTTRYNATVVSLYVSIAQSVALTRRRHSRLQPWHRLQ